MDLSLVAPELRAPMRRIPQLPIHRAWVRRLARLAVRWLRTDQIHGVTIEQPAGAGVRVYRPATVRTDAALLWIHGGGLVIGSPLQDDHLCGHTARSLGMTVVSADYRKAPEHPFPAALNDCHAGWVWLRDNASTLGVDPSRVAVGGQSAGGGLAAALVQRLYDEGGVQPAAQWLFCPMLDDRTAARRELDGLAHRVWNNRLNRFGWASYLGVDPGAQTVAPYAVPARREDLRGLAPAWIGVGDIDLFHDEDQQYAERLRAAGVDVTVHIVPGAPHGFEAWARQVDLSKTYVTAARTWLGRALASTHG